MKLTLVRYSYSATETEGELYAPPLLPMATIEKPWNPSAEYPSGKAFHSCIPEGTYSLVPYERTNGHKVWAMVNESLGVYFRKEDRTRSNQRYKCLIHPGNIVSHSSGCLLPGLRRGLLGNELAVLKSGFRMGYAMDLLTKLLGEMSSGHTLEIRQIKGAIYNEECAKKAPK